MKTELTTDESVFRLKYKTFFPLLIAIIITTNTATSLILNVGDTAEQVEYDKDRSDRKDKATLELSNAYTDKKLLELEIEMLKEKLKNCKDAKE